MLLLFETAAGYALFKVLNKGKIDTTEVRITSVTDKPPMRLSVTLTEISALYARMHADLTLTRQISGAGLCWRL